MNGKKFLIILDKINTFYCRKCNVKLTNKNAYLSKCKHRDYICKKCLKTIDRDLHLKLDFGIDVEFYKYILEQQDYKCKICKRHQQEFKRQFAVDHDHKTGKIRGLLCNNCNTALGQVKENIKTLYEMIKYISGNLNE